MLFTAGSRKRLKGAVCRFRFTCWCMYAIAPTQLSGGVHFYWPSLYALLCAAVISGQRWQWHSPTAHACVGRHDTARSMKQPSMRPARTLFTHASMKPSCDACIVKSRPEIAHVSIHTFTQQRATREDTTDGDASPYFILLYIYLGGGRSTAIIDMLSIYKKIFFKTSGFGGEIETYLPMLSYP